MMVVVLKFFKYLKWCLYGGYTHLTLSQINYSSILEGKRVVITGGSDGIGLSIAKKCLSVGANVVITGRSIEKLTKAKSMLNSDKIHILQWDVCDTFLIENKIQEIQNTLGGVDVLVNNAGYLAGYESGAAFFDKTMSTNVKSVYFISEAFANLMKSENGAKGGHIVNISSINAYQADIHPYYISKRALNAITEGFAKKYIPYNIVVNAIAPGYCDSSINKQNALNNAYWAGAANRRITVPDEIAEIALFLISGAANGIVGQTIVCDGGTLL